VLTAADVCLLGNFYAFPQFNQKYGELQADGTYVISAAWQSGLSNGVNVGEFFGLICECSQALAKGNLNHADPH
jgi:hypothetical protein